MRVPNVPIKHSESHYVQNFILEGVCNDLWSDRCKKPKNFIVENPKKFQSRF